MTKKFKNFYSSIFVKLILVIILFAILINLAIWAFFRFSSQPEARKFFPVYISKMHDYIMKDIGTPPDTLKARQISNELNVNFRFQTEKLNWTTNSNVPTIEELSSDKEFRQKYPNEQKFSVRYNEKLVHVFKQPDGVIILSPLIPQNILEPERAIIALVVLVSVIFIPLILILKWLMDPVNKLSQAVRTIGKGNYDTNIDVKRKDEFGELAESIKDMSKRIKNSIKAKEQLLLDVSHELRTPLTRIKLGLELESPKDKINNDVREIESLINALLDSYKYDTAFYDVKLERKNIIPVLKNIISDFNSPRIIDNIAEDSEIKVLIDDTKIKIVLRNIIDNALKYSEGNIIINMKDDKDHFHIYVEDTGHGIPQKDIEMIFEPFYRADKSRSKIIRGFGLGLSISKKIIDAHNGVLEMKSIEGKGTIVEITLKK